MNIAIVIGASKYQPNLVDLPACESDSEAVSHMVQSTGKYHEWLVIREETSAALVKEKLAAFTSKHKEDKKIEEVFFYFSGHGDFDGAEFRYLLSDYDPKRPNQTSLQNSELDSLLRSLGSSLTVKIVDACQSGITYVKDKDAMEGYLKGTQKHFTNCYFMYSSQSDQPSYQSKEMSWFTRRIVEAVVNHPASTLRYKDVIDYVSDAFTDNPLQKPYFVAQADFTEIFIPRDKALIKKLSKLLQVVAGAQEERADEDRPSSFVELVKQDASKYCTEEEAHAIMEQLYQKIQNYSPPPEFRDLYELKHEVAYDYQETPNLTTIGLWLLQNKHDYFAEPFYNYKHDRVFKRKEGISGLITTTEMPYAALSVSAVPRFQNIPQMKCFVIPVISKTHLRLFWTWVEVRDIGWQESGILAPGQWTTQELPLKDAAAIGRWVATFISDMWKETRALIQAKLGIGEGQ